MATLEADLAAALDALPEPLTFWWRDDDAGRDHPRLRRLLALAADRGTDVALAVVPAWLEEAAAAAVEACSRATVLQHGIAHRDHAPPGGKKVELGGAASPGLLADGLAGGRDRLAARFGDRFLPVLVPPWNRIDPALAKDLPTLGYRGLSTFGSRPASPPLRQVNTHLDLIAWRDGRRALTLPEVLADLAGLVRQAPREPVGLLSHHLVTDEAAFLTLDRVLAILQNHPKALLAGAGTIFRETA